LKKKLDKLNFIKKWKTNIRRNKDSGKPIYAILASILLGDIALPFWVKSGFSVFWGLIYTIILASGAYLFFFLIVFLSINGILDWIEWEWFIQRKAEWANAQNGFNFWTLYFIGLLPEFIGGAARWPVYGYIAMQPFQTIVIMLASMLAGIWTRLIIINLFIEEIYLLFVYFKKKLFNSKMPERSI